MFRSQSASNISFNTHSQVSAGSIKTETTVKTDSLSNILKNTVIVSESPKKFHLNRSMTSSNN